MLSESASIVFYVVSLFVIASAIMVVALRNIFHAALFLILCLFSIAGIFILCQAEFIAAIQVLLYVGGVAVLMVFAVMLTRQMTDASVVQHNEQQLLGALVAFVFLLIALGAYLKTMAVPGGFPLAPDTEVVANSSHKLGNLLLTEFVLPFELVSVLLLAVLIGAIVIARKDAE